MQYLIGLLMLGAVAAGSETDHEPPSHPAAPPSYTLENEWDDTWLHLFDRQGRPNPDGPMLQRFDNRLYSRYELDVGAGAFPLGAEARWARQRHGVRMWVHSLGEFDLANRLQVRTEMPTWESGHIGIRYDQHQSLVFDRHQLRFDIGHRDIASTGLDAGVRFYPDIDKTDIGVEALIRYHAPRVGTAGVRLGALDAFANASTALVEARGITVGEHIRHRDVPITAGAELLSVPFDIWVGQLRAELYGGAVLPNTREHRFPDAPRRDHLRHRVGGLGAGVVEWTHDDQFAVGVTSRAISTRMQWEHDEDEEADRTVTETTHQNRVYAIGMFADRTIAGEFSHTATSRPELRTGPGVEPPWRADERRRDTREMGRFRLNWQPTRVVGAELQLLLLDRETDGEPDLGVEGSFIRATTRVALQLSDEVWASFGVGWTPDPNTAVYDGGGMTLMYIPDRGD